MNSPINGSRDIEFVFILHSIVFVMNEWNLGLWRHRYIRAVLFNDTRIAIFPCATHCDLQTSTPISRVCVIYLSISIDGQQKKTRLSWCSELPEGERSLAARDDLYGRWLIVCTVQAPWPNSPKKTCREEAVARLLTATRAHSLHEYAVHCTTAVGLTNICRCGTAYYDSAAAAYDYHFISTIVSYTRITYRNRLTKSLL